MVWFVAAKEAEKMRNTLEDLYYGNIAPGAQQIAPNSELKRATDRVARFETQLTERLDEAGQRILAKLIESKDEVESITALENFILERLFHRLKRFRRIFTRYDKLDVIFLAFVYVSLIVDALM